MNNSIRRKVRSRPSIDPIGAAVYVLRDAIAATEKPTGIVSIRALVTSRVWNRSVDMRPDDEPLGRARGFLVSISLVDRTSCASEERLLQGNKDHGD